MRPDTLSYNVNPSWLARFAIASPDGETPLTGRDMALVVEVACQLTAATPTAKNFESYVEQTLREHAEGTSRATWADVHLRNAVYRREFAFRTATEVQQTLRRLERATMDGAPLFDSVTYSETDKVTHFRIARNGAMVNAHPAFAPKRATPPHRDYAHNPFADRQFAKVRPSTMTRWTSSASVPIATRLTAWLTTPCRDGLRHGRYQLDKRDGLTLRIPFDELMMTLGMTTAESRRTPKRLDEVFERVQQDLRTLPMTFRWSWARDGRLVEGFALRASVPRFEEEFHGLPDPKRTPRLMRGSLPRLTAEAPPEPPSTVTVNEPIARPVAVPSPVTSSDDVATPTVDDIDVVTSRPEPAPEPFVAPPFDPERPVDEYDDDEWDALTDEQRDIVKKRDRRDTPPDPWESVPGFEGYDEHMNPVFDADWTKRDIRRHWYPDIVYPVTDPRDPTSMLTLSQPASIGGPCAVHSTTETHPPCPDVRQVPHRHPFGMWSSEEYEPFRTELRGGSCMAWVAAPGDSTIRWCETPDQYKVALDVGIRWSQDRRREANRRSPYSGMERMRRDWREEQGYEPGDKSHDEAMPSYLAYE